MKTLTQFIGLRALYSLTVLLTAVCGNAATPDDAPARSVKNLKLRVSANGRYFVDQDPRDGTWKAIGEYSNKGVQEFVPPSHGERDDWVLVLDGKQ